MVRPGHSATAREEGADRTPKAGRPVTRVAVDRPAAPVDDRRERPPARRPPVSPMSLLESGIPLSLLLDLMCGPHSADLLAEEQASDD